MVIITISFLFLPKILACTQIKIISTDFGSSAQVFMSYNVAAHNLSQVGVSENT